MKADEPITLGRKANRPDQIESPVRRTILAVLFNRGTMALEDLCVEVWQLHKSVLSLGSKSATDYPNFHKFRCHFYGPGSLVQRRHVHMYRAGSNQYVYVTLTDVGREVATTLREKVA